jgi:hypothetical protein
LDTIERDLKELGFTETEITDGVFVRLYDLKSSSLEFLELVTDIFHPGNNTLYFELDGGRSLADRIWDLTLLQHTETSLNRVKQFRQFRSVWFRLGFGVYVLAIVTGLTAVSATTKLSMWRPLFIASLLLGLTAVVFTVIFVHGLVRSE